MFAQSLSDFGLTGGVFLFVKIVATIGGAVVGWLLADPATRGIYWLTMRAATPGGLLFCAKAIGSIGLAAAVWTILVFAGGGLGLGLGAGLGRGKDKGADKGGDKSNGVVVPKDGKPDDKKDPKTNGTQKSQRSVVEIEILGGANFKGDDRYFLVKKSDPAFKFAAAPIGLKELDSSLKASKDSIQLKIVHTDDSNVVNNDNDPTRRLKKLATSYGIPTVGP